MALVPQAVSGAPRQYAGIAAAHRVVFGTRWFCEAGIPPRAMSAGSAREERATSGRTAQGPPARTAGARRRAVHSGISMSDHRVEGLPSSAAAARDRAVLAVTRRRDAAAPGRQMAEEGAVLTSSSRVRRPAASRALAANKPSPAWSQPEGLPAPRSPPGDHALPRMPARGPRLDVDRSSSTRGSVTISPMARTPSVNTSTAGGRPARRHPTGEPAPAASARRDMHHMLPDGGLDRSAGCPPAARRAERHRLRASSPTRITAAR